MPKAEPYIGATDEQLLTLRNSISNRLPFCSGTYPFPLIAFKLFFEKDGEAHVINLADADREQVQLLARFVLQQLLGITRKRCWMSRIGKRESSKLDEEFFATKLNPERMGLLDVIRSDLLSGLDGTRPIRFELYKLNVYGKGSFFKPHRDTLRSETVFGSLVVIFPAKHESVALRFRHKGQEWTFDSARVIKAASASQLSMGYVAFFSDVEHEVLEVTSGNRVTLTYNLYFDDKQDKLYPSASAALSSAQALTSIFRETFGGLLRDANFMPKGGYLAFALDHQYPFPKSGFPKHILAHLKGSDAMVISSVQAIGLEISLKLSYEVPDEDGILLFTDHFVEFPYAGKCTCCLSSTNVVTFSQWSATGVNRP